MRERFATDKGEDKAPVAAPSACPACHSEDIKTTSKVVTTETYWRCVACGEVWNVGRREPTRYTSYGSFRR